MTKFLNISTDNTLGGSSASDVLVASQKAVKDYVDQHGGGGGSVAIDDTTITRNGDNEIQTVATINANVATGATNPVYDWVGTLAEYETQAVATNHPDWVCYITDDCEATAYQAYTQGQTNNLLAGKVDKGHQVIEFQEPTSTNNYTWYRKYADGWVEQGGVFSQTINTGDTAWSATLPIPMANYYYVVNVQTDGGYAGNTTIQCENNGTTQIKGYARAPSGGGSKRIMWSVSGMAA